MSLLNRLVLVLGVTVMLIIGGYTLLSNNQRSEIIRGATTRETAALAEGLAVISRFALEAGRTADLHSLLILFQGNEDVHVAFLVDAAGTILAGSDGQLDCLGSTIRSAGNQVGGWSDCPGQRIYWTRAPVLEDGTGLVIGKAEMLLDESSAAAVMRQLILGVILVLGIILALGTVLNRLLIRPLEQIQEGILRLVRDRGQLPLDAVTYPGKLRELAVALNETATDLDRSRQKLVEEAEARLALENQLQESERFALIGRLSGALGHELASPLSLVKMRTEAIRRIRGLPAEADVHAREVLKRVDWMVDFLRGILILGRHRLVVFETVNVGGLVQEVAEEALDDSTVAGIELSVSTPADVRPIIGHAALLRNALQNLVRNAVQALRDQSGERKLSVSVVEDDDWVCIRVEDTGPGIPEEHRERIFEPFFSTKEMGQGTGLGLPIARAVIERHGGSLRLEHCSRGGLVALVHLPTSRDSRLARAGGT